MAQLGKVLVDSSVSSICSEGGLEKVLNSEAKQWAIAKGPELGIEKV